MDFRRALGCPYTLLAVAAMAVAIIDPSDDPLSGIIVVVLGIVWIFLPQ